MHSPALLLPCCLINFLKFILQNSLFLRSLLPAQATSHFLLFHVEIMSCNGCRVLRKGCSENCMLRQCLQWIDSPQAQSNATLFVAKFFGRAGLMSFISAVPEIQRPALFQSLLYEAVGRTVNPVSGAVGLLWTGNWNLCQSATETVLCGGKLQALPDLDQLDDLSESAVLNCSTTPREVVSAQSKALKRDFHSFHNHVDVAGRDLDLRLTTGLPNRAAKRRAATPSEESETTTSGSGLENCSTPDQGGERKLLSLFV